MRIYLKRFGMMVLAVSGLIMASCETDDNADVVVVVISEERAVEIVAASLAYNTYGLALKCKIIFSNENLGYT